MRKAKTAVYRTAGGIARFKALGEGEVRVDCAGAGPPSAHVKLVVSDFESESLMNDKLDEGHEHEMKGRCGHLAKLMDKIDCCVKRGYFGGFGIPSWGPLPGLVPTT